MPTGSALQNPHTFSATPPPQPLSKRDKRRNLLSDRLNDLTASFAQNRDTHYRQQLQALQIDMNLIMRAEPYSGTPLADTGDEIAEMVTSAVTGNNSHNGMNGQRRSEGDGAALAGRWYAKFAEDVNNAMEDRDAGLTMLSNKHERTLHDLHQTNLYKIRLAQEEHSQLANTLRERLIQSMGQKKNRLMREKEHLDIADSNALLLHPNQFSIINPASPGGAQSNRKTRHTRHRLAEADELGGISAGDGAHKRKRKGTLEDNDTGSPAPVARITETGVASPYRDTRAKIAAAQMEAPVYSIERLFTEKELSLHLSTAAVAAAQYFVALKAQENGTAIEGENGTQTAENTDGEEALGLGGGANHEGEIEEEAIPAAPEMDRITNQSFHATRSTRNAGGTSALNILGDLAISEKMSGFPPSLPVILPSSAIPKIGHAPPPPSLRPEDAEDDLSKMEQLTGNGHGSVDKRILAEVCAPIGTQPYRHGVLPDLGATGSNVAISTTTVNTATLVGGVTMSAQSSMAGLSDIGGVPMSRYGGGSSMGLMKRSASGAGFANGGDGGKRIKSR
ncbi:MAG: hypothetical protein M1827_005312 [Pycnora praestabilis]|nr:MAG: hypothetical protein M1827_005312 [Pycnora praestabilis]